MGDLPDGFVLEDVGGSPELPTGFVPEAPTDPLNQGVNLGLSYMHGRTLGLGGKAMSALGAVPAKIGLEGLELVSKAGLTPNEYVAPSLGDVYKDIHQDYKGHLEQSRRDNPILSPIAEVAGGVRTGYGLSKTGTGQGLSRWLGSPKYANPTSLAQRAGNLFRKVGRNALVGEAAYRSYEVGSSDVGKEGEAALSGPPLGGIVGGASPVLSAGVSALTPAADDALKATAKIAKKYNIPLSLDQVTDSKAFANVQKISQELPGSGQSGFRDKQMKSFNRALTKTFGQDADKITPEVMDKAFKDVGKEFDNLGKGKTFKVDGFRKQIGEISLDRDAYSDEAFSKFLNQVDVVEKNFKNDEVTGEALSFVRNKVNKLARKANDADLKDLYRDLENTLVDTMTSADAEAKAAFSATKNKYKNLIVIEPLAAKAKGGNISPTLLNNRVSRVYGRQHVRGKSGDIGELARIGMELLPEKGGSDTLQKALYAGGAIGGLTNPYTQIPVAVGLGANRAMQSGVNRNQKLIEKLIEATPDESLLLPLGSTALSSGSLSGAITK